MSISLAVLLLRFLNEEMFSSIFLELIDRGEAAYVSDCLASVLATDVLSFLCLILASCVVYAFFVLCV